MRAMNSTMTCDRLAERMQRENLRADVAVQARQAHVPASPARRSTHLKAKSSRMVKPNFESSQPVRMYSCVSASTPGVMRM